MKVAYVLFLGRLHLVKAACVVAIICLSPLRGLEMPKGRGRFKNDNPKNFEYPRGMLKQALGHLKEFPSNTCKCNRIFTGKGCYGSFRTGNYHYLNKEGRQHSSETPALAGVMMHDLKSPETAQSLTP
jgi:hypothetical protein